MPKFCREIKPFLPSVFFRWRREKLVHSGKSLVGERNEVVFEHCFQLCVLGILSTEDFQHMPNVLFGLKLGQIQPMGYPVVCDFRRIFLVILGFSDGVVPETVNKLRVYRANEQTRIMERTAASRR